MTSIHELQIRVVKKCQAQGVIRNSIPAEDLIRTYKAACTGAIVHWAFSEEDYSLTKWADMYFNIIFLP